MLSVLFLVIVISLFFFFAILMKSSSRRIGVTTLSSMLASPLLSFLDTYWLYMSYLRCKAFYIIISFLALSSIYWSSSLVFFKNGSEYLRSKTVQICILLMRFQLQNLLSSRFVSSPLVWWCLFPVSPSTCNYYFTLLRVFTPASAEGFSSELKWQQVSSSLQDPCQYSD